MVHEGDVVRPPEPCECRNIHDKNTARFEGAEDFGDGGFVIGNMLNGIEADNRIEEIFHEWELFSVSIDQMVEAPVMGKGEGIVTEVDAYGVAP